MLSPVLDAVWLFLAVSQQCRLGQPGRSTGSLGKEITIVHISNTNQHQFSNTYLYHGVRHDKCVFERLGRGEFMYLAFTCMPSESYCWGLRSLLCLCDVFWALINSLVCSFCTSAAGLVLLQIWTPTRDDVLHSVCVCVCKSVYRQQCIVSTKRVCRCACMCEELGGLVISMRHR